MGTTLREASGNDRRSTRDHVGREALRGLEQPASPPVREPQHDAHAERAAERRGEDRVDRAHVRDHRSGTRPPRELPRERIGEPQPAPGARGGAEGPDDAVPGQRAGHCPVREDDDLVDARRKRGDLGHGRAEVRVVRIDALRDEDEPHELSRCAIARSTSSAILAAYSSGVYVHADDHAWPASP